MKATCRACDATEPTKVLFLGHLPLANALVRPNAPPEPRHTLTLAYCTSCTLVQILETVPRETLFRDYVYFSSYSESFLRHAEALADALVRDRELGPKSLVVEAGSNDGYLLQFFKARGVPVLGIEPAENIARDANAKGIRTITEFFDASVAKKIGEKADVFIALNVLAHVSDLHGFLDGVRGILKPSGVAVFEVPCVGDMIERLEFDTIYHEHLCYFSATSAAGLFARHGLKLTRVERLDVHGGSLRLTVGGPADGSADSARNAEAALGLERFRVFGRQVAAMREPLVGALREIRGRGKCIAGYGAAAKATVLLNYFGIDSSIIEFVVDRNPHKQGLLIPGVRIPVRPPEALFSDKPDYVVILAWNLADEIIAQQEAYRRAGGKFIIPVPSVKVIE